MHGNERDQHADRQHQDRHQCGAQVHQKDHADGSYDETLLDQRALQVVDGTQDQIRSVVDRLNRHAIRQTGRDLGDLDLQVSDDLQRVLSEARHRDSGNHFALAIEFGQAAPLVGRHFDACNVTDQHRSAALALDHQPLDIGLAAQVALATHHELRLGHLDHAAADVAVGVANDLRDLHQGDAEAAQLQRIHRDLIGLHETANRGDLGHTGCLGKLVSDVPVLDGA